MTILKYKNVLIIDSKIGNIGSLKRAISKIGYNYTVSNKFEKNLDISHIILPGVGSFDNGIKILKQNDLIHKIIYAVQEKGIPILGICLGMQLFASKGFENNQITDGLNLIPGIVKKLETDSNLKLPHLGWNEVDQDSENKLFKNIPNKKDFYFVHNYFFEPNKKNHIIGKTIYGSTFASALNKSNIYGVQFHPEKSLNYGLQLLDNFINT